MAWAKNGADGGTRTPDPRITNALLYQLSYIGIRTRTGRNYVAQSGYRLITLPPVRASMMQGAGENRSLSYTRCRPGTCCRDPLAYGASSAGPTKAEQEIARQFGWG